MIGLLNRFCHHFDSLSKRCCTEHLNDDPGIRSFLITM